MARGGHNQVARVVCLREVALERDLVQGRDRLGHAQNRPPERVILPELLGEQLVDEVVRRVLHHLDFFEDDLLLAFDVVGGKLRTPHDIREHLNGQRQMLVQDLQVVAGVFLGGEGVHLAADGVDRLGNVLG